MRGLLSKLNIQYNDLDRMVIRVIVLCALLFGCSSPHKVDEPLQFLKANPISTIPCGGTNPDPLPKRMVGQSPTATAHNMVVDGDPVTEKIEVVSNVVISESVLMPEDWMNWPVVPQATNTAIEIYNSGLAAGNNPHAFSKIGDCQSIPSMYLSTFDNRSTYNLGEEYAYLNGAIDWFVGSFARESESVRPGFNAASILSPVWADSSICQVEETPLDCEFRLHRPSFAIISLEAWWAGTGTPQEYEAYLREIIVRTIEYDVVPILATKADNFEGEHLINASIARLASEFDIPLWNFWRAVQTLPNHGLSEDEFHLTFAYNQFDDPQSMVAAWPWRNLTALQSLDSVWRGVTQPRIALQLDDDT